MTAQIIKILATSKTPRYRPLPTEPATVIVLPMIRVEPRPKPTRSTPSERLRALVSPSVELKVRKSIGDLEAKMRQKYRLDAAADRGVDKPCDT